MSPNLTLDSVPVGESPFGFAHRPAPYLLVVGMAG